MQALMQGQTQPQPQAAPLAPVYLTNRQQTGVPSGMARYFEEANYAQVKV